MASEKGVIGAQLYTVRAFCKTIEDIADSLAKIRKIGYTTVQVSGIGPVDWKDLAKVVKDAGLTVAATHCAWQDFVADTDALIERHKLVGCVHAAIGTLPGEYYVWPDGMNKFLAELAPVAAKLIAAGIDFSYHNHHKELMRVGPFDSAQGKPYDPAQGKPPKTWLETLYDRAAPEHLKAEIDTYWIQAGGGDPAAWIAKYPGRQPILHLKDMAVSTTKEVRFAPVGEGNLNWPAILAAAKSAAVRYYVVEQDESYESDPFDSLASSYRYLRSVGLA